jgi:hypothetical protein
MKRNVNELIDTIYRYYSRGIDITNDNIAWALTPKKDRGYWYVSTDGCLRKEWLAHWLDRLDSPIHETPIAVRARAAGAELEALVAAWDGNGSPTDAMVAWASDFLASWVVDEK